MVVPECTSIMNEQTDCARLSVVAYLHQAGTDVPRITSLARLASPALQILKEHVKEIHNKILQNAHKHLERGPN
jgi:hypothetical protein